MDPVTIGTAIGTTLLTNFATKGDSAPIQTLNDLWYLAFGRLQLLVDKKRANHAAQLEAYKNELVNAVSDIPDENLIEPPLSIVGPALEASKYYIEVEVLRKMFAKVVASSMDNRKSGYTHHAFIEIIKQLSPLDAQNISILKEHKTLPIVNCGIDINNSQKIPIYSDVFLNNSSCNDVDLLRSSITNLKRLGLVVTVYNLRLKDKLKYEIFRENKFLNVQFQALVDRNPGSEVFYEHGILEPSPLGSDFIRACL
jgi:Abortive infection alpha